MPKSNIEFWRDKFSANMSRDEIAYTRLNALGWRVLVVWECETKDEDALIEKFRTVFGIAASN